MGVPRFLFRVLKEGENGVDTSSDGENVRPVLKVGQPAGSDEV